MPVLLILLSCISLSRANLCDDDPCSSQTIAPICEDHSSPTSPDCYHCTDGGNFTVTRECPFLYRVAEPPECCYVGGPAASEFVHSNFGPSVGGGSSVAENGLVYGVKVYIEALPNGTEPIITTETPRAYCQVHRSTVLDFTPPDAFYPNAVAYAISGFQQLSELMGYGMPDAPYKGAAGCVSWPCAFAPWGKEEDDKMIGMPMVNDCNDALSSSTGLQWDRIMRATLAISRNPDTGCTPDASNYTKLWLVGENYATNGSYNPDCATSLFMNDESSRLATANAFLAQWKAEDAAAITGDPHLIGFHGDKFDFRGRNNTVYALLSARHLAVNALFALQTFVMGGTCERCSFKTVHGSFIKAVYVRTLTSAGKTVRFAYLADAPSRAAITTEVDGVDVRGGAVHTEAEVSTSTPDATQYVIDDVTLNLARKHAREATLTISNGEFEVQATSRFLSWSKQNNNKKRIDVAIKPLKLGVVASPVAPHGLIGQTFDGDKTAIDGAIDDYSPSEVYTKAMGEGAIEGTAEEYEVRASDPFSDAFKYSRRC